MGVQQIVVECTPSVESVQSAAKNPQCYNPGAMKRQRHNAILDLVRSGEIASQEELMLGLKSRHIEVSQSTLSRDIQELRLAKTGGMYTVVESEPAAKGSD